MTIGINQFPNFLDVFLIFFAVEGRPERSLSTTEARPSLKRLFHSWIRSQRLDLIFRKPPKTFSIIWNKISEKHVAHENHPSLNVEKFAEQARHALTLIDTAQWLRKIGRYGLWHSLRKLTARKRNQQNLAPPSRWRANSKVRKLYELPSNEWYVCMVYVWMHACVSVCAHVCMYIRTHMCTYGVYTCDRVSWRSR